MNEGFNKIMIPLGVSWVAVSLVIGLVIVVLPLSNRVRVVEKTIIKYVQEGKVETGNSNDSLVTKVKIQGTVDPSDPNSLETKVKVLKNNL